jgi:8-amino-7-oxononanoate synthase
MSDLREDLAARLEALEAEGLRRRLSPPAGIDFSSNDYLGIATSHRLRDLFMERIGSAPLTAPASRLLRGHLPEHAALEERLARFKGSEAALIFSSGYQANLGVLTALAGPQDRVLSDELNHASIVDGVRLSRARKVIFPHLDAVAVEASLAERWPHGRTFLVTESYFSMDGDVAPLDRFAELARRYGASLIVDDAHATGVFGEDRGAGLVAAFGVVRDCDAVISTFGKALGGFGAFVAGPRVVIEWLVNRARPFVYTTAVPPLLLHLMAAGLELCEVSGERRTRIHRLAERLRGRLRAAGLDCLASRGPIVPVVLGDNRAALEVAMGLSERGFDVRAVRPPSVPQGTARLRISVHADHDENTVDGLGRCLVECVERVMARR